MISDLQTKQALRSTVVVWIFAIGWQQAGRGQSNRLGFCRSTCHLLAEVSVVIGHTLLELVMLVKASFLDGFGWKLFRTEAFT